MTPEELAKLTPAPWVPCEFDILGPPNECLLFCGQNTSRADAELVSLLRNAEDVQMRRKLNSEWYADGWGVDSGLEKLPDELELMRWRHPAVALVEADRWLTEREGKK